jgi:hypothetical protein
MNRRIEGTRANTRRALERSLGSWLCIRGGWESVLDFGRGMHNWERIARAESKLAECQSQIGCIETRLRSGQP